MYASKRSIGKQGLYSKAPESRLKGKGVSHGNGGNRRGRAVFVQQVTDEHGKVLRTLYHISVHNSKEQDMDAHYIRRKSKRLRKSMANQPR